MSVNDSHVTQRNIPEECRFDQHCSGSLKSGKNLENTGLLSASVFLLDISVK